MSGVGQERFSERQAATKTRAHVIPLFVFLGVLLLMPLLEVVGFYVDNEDLYPWYRHAPEQWLYPVQTIIGILLLCLYRRNYDFGPVRGLGLAVACGLLGITFWLLPGHIFRESGMEEGWWKILGFTSRSEGFDPSDVGGSDSVFYWLSVGMRFVRMVVVVALVEEVFWRGFLMRYLLDKDGDYWEQPFGKFSWMSFLVVTLLFMFAHAPSDYLGALVYGSFAYTLAVTTKSLAACILMHAVANLVLGIYVMITGQLGYW
jgi:CAAX prenyl protease-like protein